MTISIAGRCARTGQFGAAVSSSSPAVAARCIQARAGVGAACTQNVTDPRLSTRLLHLMAEGEAAQAAMDRVTKSEPLISYRQLSAIDAQGRTAFWSGEQTLGTYGAIGMNHCVAAGNLLSSTAVPRAMAEGFAARPEDDLGSRLVAALVAGLEAGGEEGPVHSAGMIVVSDAPFPLTDLRVDWSDDPVGDLAKLWRLWRPQAEAYRTRALDPASAPSYGVAGDR